MELTVGTTPLVCRHPDATGVPAHLEWEVAPATGPARPGTLRVEGGERIVSRRDMSWHASRVGDRLV